MATKNKKALTAKQSEELLVILKTRFEKNMNRHKGIEWIAKFNKADDLFDNAKVEYASMKMAQALGLNISNVELEEVEVNPILLVDHFDRNCPERKKYYISAHSLMNIRKVRVGDLKMFYMHLQSDLL